MDKSDAQEEIVDAENWHFYEPLNLPPILAASVSALHENGYHGMTVRDIALRVGVTMPSLYYHYGSKEGILSALLDIAMADLLKHVRGGIAAAGGNVDAELDNFVTAMAMHVTKRYELAALHPEFRFLSHEPRTQYVTRRSEVSTALVTILKRGAEMNQFMKADATSLSRAILSMVQGIAGWYRKDGPDSPEEIASEYVKFVRRLVHEPGTDCGQESAGRSL